METATAPQHLLALGEANRRRLAHCGRRRELRELEPDAARLRVCRILNEPVEETFAGMKLGQLLHGIRGMGRHRMNKLLAKVGSYRMLHGEHRLGDLTKRERVAIGMALLADR